MQETSSSSLLVMIAIENYQSHEKLSSSSAESCGVYIYNTE